MNLVQMWSLSHLWPGASMFRLTESLIEREEEIARLEDHQAGALVVFEGWVRDHNQGKKVASLEYQVYEALAQKEGEKILAEAIHKFNLHHIVCTHRFGHLKLGEAAVWIGATATHRDDAFKATRYVIDEVKHRLPVWKKEHYVSDESEWVFCKDHHTHVHFHAEDYYKKQQKLIKQDRLADAQVLVIGAGGLGCPVLMSLATAGVGHIDVVDYDTIEISNIHRQPLYAPEVVGELKAVVAQNRISALNPFIHVHGHNKRVDHSNIEELVQGKTLVLDCSDNLETKYLVHDACMKQRIPLISASIYQYEGQVRTFIPGVTGCLRCAQSETPDDSLLGNCNDFGVLGASVSMIGHLQAQEAIHFLQNGNNSTSETTFYFNTQTLSQMKIKNFKREQCPCCEGNIELEKNDLEIDVHELKHMDAILVDVREIDVVNGLDYKTSKKPVVLYCHRGVKSKRLVSQLRLEGFSDFYSLRGGAPTLGI